MLFSLLVANYNNGHFFKDCFKSIIEQTYKDWEVIIVDDGSTDNSVNVIKNVIGNDNRFKIFENRLNKGCGYTKNKCAELAEGEILGFLDPDDALKKDAIQLMVELHGKNQNVAIVSSKYELVDIELNFIELGSHGCAIPKNQSYLTFGLGALTAFASFKKDMYLQSGGIDSKMKRAVDQDLYFKMEEQGQHIFLDKILYSYRIHKNSISKNDNLFKAQYWHFYAILKASERRQKLKLNIDNFSKKHIRELSSNYYLKRYIKIKQSNKLCAKFYLLLKSILASPFHRTELKFKNFIWLILNRK